jgi:hypothetical protein
MLIERSVSAEKIKPIAIDMDRRGAFESFEFPSIFTEMAGIESNIRICESLSISEKAHFSEEFKVPKLSKYPRDKQGHTLSNHPDFRKLGRFTDLYIEGGPNVRLLHAGNLGPVQRDRIRRNIKQARDNIDAAVEFLRKGERELDKSEFETLRNHFGLDPKEITPQYMQDVRNRCEKIADALYSDKFEVQLTDQPWPGGARQRKGPKAPHRYASASAQQGLYTDQFPNVTIRLTKALAASELEGADAFVTAVALGGAELGHYTHTGQYVANGVGDEWQLKNRLPSDTAINDATTYAEFSGALRSVTARTARTPERYALPDIGTINGPFEIDGTEKHGGDGDNHRVEVNSPDRGRHNEAPSSEGIWRTIEAEIEERWKEGALSSPREKSNRRRGWGR